MGDGTLDTHKDSHLHAKKKVLRGKRPCHYLLAYSNDNSHLQTKKKVLRGKRPCLSLSPGFPASRNGKQ